MVKGGSPIPIFLELRDSTFDLPPRKIGNLERKCANANRDSNWSVFVPWRL